MFKKGDKVYSILRGWGEIEDQDPCGDIGVRFKDGIYLGYKPDGKRDGLHLIPELYHTEPVITVPKRRVEHTGWIGVYPLLSNQDTQRRTTYICNDKKDFKNDDWLDGYTLQQITYYTEE